MNWNELIELLRLGEKLEEFQRRREEIAEWLPSVRILFDYDQNNLWMHSVHTVLGIDKSIDDDMLYLAALLHDIGKPCSRCKGKKDDNKFSHY